MDLNPFYARYASLVDENELTRSAILSGEEALDFYKSIPGHMGDYRYAPGKWTLREVLAHVIDSERIFAYRLLRFSRRDSTELPGFDENSYMENLVLGNRQLHHLINEFANLRASSTDLIATLPVEVMDFAGTASGNKFTVRQMARILVGHEIHHRNVIKERYLNN